MSVSYAPSRLSVPMGFEYVLESLAREVLREQPKDIIEFAAKYFKAKLVVRNEGLTDTPLHKASTDTQPIENTPVESVNKVQDSDPGDASAQDKLMQGGATSPQNEPISSADEEAAKDETEYVIPEEQPGNNDEGVGDVRNNTEACSGDEEVGGVQEVSATDDDEDEDGTKADDDQPVPESEPENDQEPTVDEPPVEAQPVEDSVAKESANEEPLVVETSPVEYISAQDDDTEGELSDNVEITGADGGEVPSNPSPEDPQPEPAEPESTEPESTEPEPTKPESEPEPTEPEPEPSEPEPTEPESEPEPTEPEPIEPEPEPSEPEPTEPESEPEPTEPEPTEPEPTEPESTEPEPEPTVEGEEPIDPQTGNENKPRSTDDEQQ